MLCVIYIEVPSAHHERGKPVPNLLRTRNQTSPARVSSYSHGANLRRKTRTSGRAALVLQ